MEPNSLSWFRQGTPVATPMDLLNMGYSPNYTPSTSTSVIRQLTPKIDPRMFAAYTRAEQNNPLQMFEMTASLGEK